MQIQQRPALFSPIGGLLTNPVRYVVSTATRFVSASVRSGDAVLGELRAAARNGAATIDISSLLRAALTNTEIRSLPFSCVFTDGAGAVLSDAANVRYAVAAALPFGVSDYGQYAATGSGHQAEFATRFEQPVLFEGVPLELSVAVGNVFELYLERAYYRVDGQLLEIKSDFITDRKTLLTLTIDTPAPPAGTRYIEVRLTNEFRPWVWVPDGGGETELNDWATADFADADWY